MASATKIGVKTLHSLEGDQYSELPAKPFVRGFVTSYARFVGLEPTETLTRFGAFIDSKAHDRPNREAGHSGYAFERREGEQSRTILWVVMGSFVVLGGIAAVFVKRPHNHHHNSNQADKLRAAYSVAPSPTPLASPSASAAVAGASPGPSASPSGVSTVVTVAPSPSPSSTPISATTPSPTPAPTPTEIVKTPEPTATPSTPASTPTPIVSTNAGEIPDEPFTEGDPLNSGLKLKPSEILHKVVFKATDSAWVRYKVDGRPMTQFVFRTGRVLVLRARQAIRFQVSPPKAVTYSYKGSAFKPVVGDSHLVTRQNDATLFFPSEIADSIDEPFKGEKPLSSRSVPAPRPSSSPTPTE